MALLFFLGILLCDAIPYHIQVMLVLCISMRIVEQQAVDAWNVRSHTQESTNAVQYSENVWSRRTYERAASTHQLINRRTPISFCTIFFGAYASSFFLGCLCVVFSCVWTRVHTHIIRSYAMLTNQSHSNAWTVHRKYIKDFLCSNLDNLKDRIKVGSDR